MTWSTAVLNPGDCRDSPEGYFAGPKITGHVCKETSYRVQRSLLMRSSPGVKGHALCDVPGELRLMGAPRIRFPAENATCVCTSGDGGCVCAGVGRTVSDLTHRSSPASTKVDHAQEEC